MALPESVLSDIWHGALADKAPPFSMQLGICKFWSDDPYTYGPPLGGEWKQNDGTVVQAFAHAAIRWIPGQGAEKVA